jgi:teichuronic acid biosynthesis glycosyltransferase TuaC
MYGGVMADQVTRTVNDRPTVVTFHGSDLLGEHLSGTVRKLIAGYGVWASWNAARRAHRVVTVSKSLRDALPRNVKRSKVSIIPNGIDLQRFKPLDRDRCRKRLEWGADTFHILFPANSGDPVKRPKLAQAALDPLRRMGIRGELHYLRGVKNEEVPVWLNASNVLLLTSLHEGSPTIVKEALACNLPVVSVDVGDVSERIKDIDGCYIALPDQNDLAAKLFLVHAGSGKINGRNKMKEFSLVRIAQQLGTVYAEVVRSSNERTESITGSSWA